jgi:linoleoyl-CoA desaturase
MPNDRPGTVGERPAPEHRDAVPTARVARTRALGEHELARTARPAFRSAVLSTYTGAVRPLQVTPRTMTIALDPLVSEPHDSFTTTQERLDRFAAAIDAIRAEFEAKLGEEDVRHIRGVRRVSRIAEVVGRTLLHFSPEPISFGAGVVGLWLHKQLEATEIGHSALHGVYDRFPELPHLHSKRYWWDVPIDEESWRYGHNIRHHGYTNIAGRDPDIHFGAVRFTPNTPYAERKHKNQLLFTLLVIFPNFGFLAAWHFAGLVDVYFGNQRPEEFDFIEDRSWPSVASAHKRVLRKFIPFYFKEFVLFPALAGPMFWKPLLGSYLAEVMANLYSAATIFCGHVGDDVVCYSEGTRAHGRGAFYAMQVEATNNFEVPLPVSILCGALDRQIEHHLFPRLPPNRLREVAPKVKAACQAHGIEYRTASWPATLRKVFRRIVNLSRDASSSPSAPADAAA